MRCFFFLLLFTFLFFSFFLSFFLYFFWAADVSNLSRSQLLVQFEIWNLILRWAEQDTRQNTELKKSVIRSVLLCLSCLFTYILTIKFIKKKTEKKKWKQKKKKSWILLNQTRTEKQTRAAALRHTIYFFLALWCTPTKQGSFGIIEIVRSMHFSTLIWYQKNQVHTSTFWDTLGRIKKFWSFIFLTETYFIDKWRM